MASLRDPNSIGRFIWYQHVSNLPTNETNAEPSVWHYSLRDQPTLVASWLCRVPSTLDRATVHLTDIDIHSSYGLPFLPAGTNQHYYLEVCRMPDSTQDGHLTRKPTLQSC